MINQCEGYHRQGGALSLGKPVWRQCKNESIAIVDFLQNKKRDILPICNSCMQLLEEWGISVISVKYYQNLQS